MLLIVFGVCVDLRCWRSGEVICSRIALFAREGLTFALSGHQKLLCIASFLLLCTQERAKSDFGAFLGRSGSAWACKINAFTKQNKENQGISFCALRHPKSLPERPKWSPEAPQSTPCGLQWRPKTPPRRSQELPLTLLEHSKCFRIAWTGQNCIPELSNSLPRAILGRFFTYFGEFLIVLLWISTFISVLSCWAKRCMQSGLPCIRSLCALWYSVRRNSWSIIYYILYIIYYIWYVCLYVYIYNISYIICSYII